MWLCAHKTLLGLLFVLCLATACTGSLPEGDSGSVALITRPQEYTADAPMYEAVFTHALSALKPLD